MRKKKASSASSRRSIERDAAPAQPPPDVRVITARAATEDELAAIVRAQQNQPSAESFWKSAGRLAKLR